MSYYRYRPSQGVPPVVLNLIIINVIVFAAQNMVSSTSGFNFDNTFALHDIHSIYFKPFQIFTYMFMHGGVSHIFFNMFALFIFGRVLEDVWGGKRFLIFYIVCGLGAAVSHLAVLYYQMEPVMRAFHSLPADQQAALVTDPRFMVNIPTIGASGAIFGCLVAFGYLFPNTEIYLYFFIPLKAKWFVLLYGGLELFLGFQNSAGDNIAHFAHLGGAVTGFIIVYIWNKTNKQRFY